MVRGTFANIRLRNQLAPGTEGGWTLFLPGGEKMSIYDASVKYREDGVPLVVIAGKEYGSGSSRDWAAKGTLLLGVRAVIAESYERIHRSNLIGMGVLPLEFKQGETRESLGLTGHEIFSHRRRRNARSRQRPSPSAQNPPTAKRNNSPPPPASTLPKKSPTTNTAAFCSTSSAKCCKLLRRKDVLMLKQGFGALLLALSFAIGALAQESAAPVTAVRAGRLIDVDAGRVLTNQIILIRGGKIEALGDTSRFPRSDHHRSVEHDGAARPRRLPHAPRRARGRQLDPMYRSNGPRRRSASRIHPQCARHAAGRLHHGARRRRLPRLQRRRHARRHRARHHHRSAHVRRGRVHHHQRGRRRDDRAVAPDIQLPWDLRYGEANSPWEVRQKIRELAHRGADHIKVLSTGAVLTHGSNPKSIEFTPEELRAAVEEAANFGLRVEAHAHAAEGIKNAIRAGVASVEHATLIDDEGIALAKQHGTYLDMDIYDEECIQSATRRHARRFSASTIADLGEAQRRNFTKAVRAGVKMTFGTDAGVCPHGINARQFAFMVKYGMTPMQAIQSATVNAADLIGHSELFGSITAGKSADIIAVNGDPLADIHELEHVGFVMKEGRVYKQVQDSERGSRAVLRRRSCRGGARTI